MRHLLVTLVLIFSAQLSFGQDVEETFPKTLWCPDDIFLIKYKNDPVGDTFHVSRKDRNSPGINPELNDYVTFCYGKDSIRLRYHNNIPYAHIFYVNFESPKGKTTLRFHFNTLFSYFSNDYGFKNRGNTQFDIPEVYELANIIWTLSATGQRAKDFNEESDYYKKVKAFFGSHTDHPIFKYLDFADSIAQSKYYEFRENSFAFNFQDSRPGSSNCKLLFNGPYYYVYGNELADSSLFGKLLPMVEDFAVKSDFRKFYKANTMYYTALIDRQRVMMPVKKMWTWLEEQFPKTKYNSYRVVFSPLIRGSHSTQNYLQDIATQGVFREAVMFVCGPDRYDSKKELKEKQKEGLMSGIVFTEIDHNYVNPATNKYSKLVDSIFSKRNTWAKQGNGSDFYNNGMSVFNEYMTHAVFCLYILDSYDKTTADLVISYRETMMVDRRNFIKFREFNKELVKIRKEHAGMKLAELYPFILNWCKAQN